MASLSSLTSLMRRLLTPIFLVSPLIVLLLVPALVYGVSSDRAADAANQAMVRSLTTGDDQVSISREFVCAQSTVDTTSLEFTSLRVNAPNQKTSLSTVGFDQAVVTMKGWATNSAKSASTTSPDSVTAYLHQQDGEWCLYELDVLPGRR